MDKIQDYVQDMMHIQKLIIEAQELAYNYVSPNSDEGTFLSEIEREELKARATNIIKEAMSRLSVVGFNLEKSSPCSFCPHSKPPQDN